MGRSAIYMVMGVTAMFLFFGKTMSDGGTEAFENAIVYYEHTQVYNIAVAGANMACNQLFLDNTWRTGFSNVVMNGGTVNVTLDTTTYAGKIILYSTAFYQSDTHRVKVVLSPSSLAKFAMYSGNVSAAAKMRSGDTIDGPIHFNNKLTTQGNPVFMGKATMGSLQMTSGTPTFLGGYQTGVNITFPDYTPSASAIVAGASAAGGTNDYQVGGEMWLKFSVVSGDAKVQYKNSAGGSWSTPEDVSSFAPTGNIAIVNGALHVEGTIKGQLNITSTVSPSTTTPSASVGATFIENNVRYNTDPLVTPSSTDMLGLVSAGDITIQQLPLRVDGAVFTDTKATLGGTLNNDTPAKKFQVVGAFITKNIYSTDWGTGATKGANFHMKYDTRMETSPPAHFPFPSNGNGLEVLSWFE